MFFMKSNLSIRYWQIFRNDFIEKEVPNTEEIFTVFFGNNPFVSYLPFDNDGGD